MRYEEEFRCPFCDSYIGDGYGIFMRDGDIIGCESCIDHETVEILTEEELEEELEADYYDSLYDEMKIERCFGL